MKIFKYLSFGVSFGISILWSILMSIDAIIYEVADRALRSFFEIARISFDTQAYQSSLGVILNRVMVLAGVFALFKIAIMLINYIVDPSKMDKANKNGTTFVQKLVIAVVLLVASPIIFRTLAQFQNLVIKQNVIPKLIYGPDKFQENEEEELIPRQSARFVNNVFLMFFVPKDNVCDEATINTGENYCQEYKKVETAYKDGDKIYGVSNLINYTSSGQFDYTPFISGLAGIILIYYFVVYSFDLGKRLIKLVILQIISPIPIIMSVDPSSKNNRLNKFVETYSGIYLQVFIRIITMYLAFVVLNMITTFGIDDNLSTGSLLAEPGWFVKLVLYIGVLQALKDIPKLIEDAIGVKMGNAPGKSFGSVLSGIIGGTAGFIGGAAMGAVSGGVGGALAGAGYGLFNGATKASSAKNAVAASGAALKSVQGAYSLGGKVRGAGGLPMFGMGAVQNMFGGKSRDEATLTAFDKQAEGVDKKIGEYNKNISGINRNIRMENENMGLRTRSDQMRSKLESTMEKSFTNSSPNRASLQQYKGSDTMLQQMRADYNNKLSRVNGVGFANDVERNNAFMALQNKELEVENRYKAEREQYFENMFNEKDKPENVEFKQALDEYNSYVSSNGMEDRVINTYNGQNDGIEAVKNINELDKQSIQSEIENYQNQVRAQEKLISDAEIEKEQIAKSKKEFQQSSGYISRNKREEKPQVKPRDI